MNTQLIRERFRNIGLGINLPSDESSWTTIGDLVHWSDLIGLQSGGQRLYSDESEVVYSILQCIGTRIGVRKQDFSLGLTIPVGIDDIATTISQHLKAKRGEGVVDEDGMELMRRILVRRQELVPLVIPKVREALKSRGMDDGSSRGRIDSDLRVLACILAEFGTEGDLDLIASVFHRFREKAQASILGAVHARGWQDEPTWERAISQSTSTMIQGLHDSLIKLRVGGEPSELLAWLEHSHWGMRIGAMECVFKLLPSCRPSQALLEMLLTRIEEEDDNDCGIMLGWTLARILDQQGVSAALEILIKLQDLPSKDIPGFHAAMRALVRLKLSADRRGELLEAIAPLESDMDSDVLASIRIVKMHLLGALSCLNDAVARMSTNRGWFQDLCEPGRNWTGHLKDLFDESLATEPLIWVCLGDRCEAAPMWLRTLWLRRRLAEEPQILGTLESGCRLTRIGENRRIAAMAILTHSEPLEVADLYLACTLGKDLPLTVPKDSLENAVALLNHTHDSGLEERAHEMLVNGGPIVREAARYWYSAQVVNDFDLDRSTAACERLSMLGIGESVKALPYNHLRVLEPLSGCLPELEPGNFLYGPLSQEEPEAVVMRLLGETRHETLRSMAKMLAQNWDRAPAQVLAAWEVLSESEEWIRKEAACILAQEAGDQFLSGRAGEAVRERLKVLAQDEDDDVKREALEALRKYELTIEPLEP